MNHIFQTLDDEIARLKERVEHLEEQVRLAREGCELGFRNERELQKVIERREEQMRRTGEKIKQAFEQWKEVREFAFGFYRANPSDIGRDTSKDLTPEDIARKFNTLDHLAYLTAGGHPKDRW
jgi:phytoene dehydrogenase-like protein